MGLTAQRADLLAWVARCRALLAVAPGGACSGSQVAILGGPGRAWLVRGHPWQVSPAWIDAAAFPGALRARGSGRLVGLGGLGGDAAELRCGLCGGHPTGMVDEWLAAHPLAGGR